MGGNLRCVLAGPSLGWEVCTCLCVPVGVCPCARVSWRHRRPCLSPQLPAVLPAGRRLSPVLVALGAALGHLSGQPGVQHLGGAAAPAHLGQQLQLPGGLRRHPRPQAASGTVHPPRLPVQVRGGLLRPSARAHLYLLRGWGEAESEGFGAQQPVLVPLLCSQCSALPSLHLTMAPRSFDSTAACGVQEEISGFVVVCGFCFPSPYARSFVCGGLM